jgi:hypothetical protein
MTCSVSRTSQPRSGIYEIGADQGILMVTQPVHDGDPTPQ